MMMDVGDADNKELFIGSPPGDTEIAQVSSPNFDARNAQIVQAIPHELIQPQFRGSEDYDWMFDHQGNVVDYRTALQNAHTMGIPPASVGAGYQEVLESLGQKNQGSAFRDHYNEVILQAVAGTQPR